MTAASKRAAAAADRRRRWRHVLDGVVENWLHAQVSPGVRRLQRPRFKRGCDFFTCGDLNVGLVVDVRRDVLVVAERRAGDVDAMPDEAAVGALEAAELHAEAGEVGVVREPRAEVGAHQ